MQFSVCSVQCAVCSVQCAETHAFGRFLVAGLATNRERYVRLSELLRARRFIHNPTRERGTSSTSLTRRVVIFTQNPIVAIKRQALASPATALREKRMRLEASS